MMSIKGLGRSARVASLLVLPVLALPAAAQGSLDAGVTPADVFHPDNQPGEDGSRPAAPEPVWGGSVTVHLASLPKHMSYPTENSAVTRRMLYEVHESLLVQDWEHHDYRPRLVTSFDTEDMLVLASGADAEYGDAVVDVNVKDDASTEDAQKTARVIYGRVEDRGDYYHVLPVSKGSALGGALEVSREHVESLQRGTVFTFYLRSDVVWHPYSAVIDGERSDITGHMLDADDVLFSWKIYDNPRVDCDEKRGGFQKVTRGEKIDEQTVRFFFEGQYYGAVATLGTDMTILPTHVYDLSDPDNPQHDPEATDDEQAVVVNEHSANQQWIGLGPYRVVEYSDTRVKAERFAGYFDKDNAGYLDEIVWLYIDDDSAAMNALLNGELDYFERVKSADYFGEATKRASFTDKYYKGYRYLGTYGYTGWNMYKPQLKEKVVRQALAHAFDFDEYLKNNYKNLARQVTGPFPYESEGYNKEVEALPYDPDLAIELLEDAGWYDRDGDDIIDKDGISLEIDFAMPSGNDASKNLGLKMQQAFAEIGVKLNIVGYEWATFLDKLKKRELDAANLAWVPGLESDPEGLWHSKWGEYERQGSNNSGVMEPELDRLIRAGQRELDREKRQQIWREMHAYIYDLQPYLFGFNVPSKFAMTKRIRGYQSVAIDPGYIIRRWHFTSLDEPGTRATREPAR